jgi:methylase of polypeptide subunit release factors
LNIREFISDTKREATLCRNEEEFRYIFLKNWKDLLEQQGYADSIRIEETIIKGRADARFRSLIFEFKNPHTKVLSTFNGRVSALQELKEHLNQFVKRGLKPEELKGILTDGIDVASISYDKQRQEYITVDEFERFIKDESAFRSFNEAEFLFDTLLFGLTKRELTPENLIEEFGPNSETCRRTVSVLWDVLNNGFEQPRIHAFYETWKLLFSLSTQKVASAKDLATTLDSYGLSPNYVKSEEDIRKFLFLIHTYYSLILKFLAFGVADELKMFGSTQLLQQIKKDPIGGLESSEKILPSLLVNIVEKDVFSWFEDSWDQELIGVIKLLAEKIINYDLRGVKKDVLKRVYQHLIPTKLRKSLGEYYTKDWTAQILLDALDYKGEGRILDPACGSGTFLILAIQKVRDNNLGLSSSDLLHKIISSVVGFDVNPIAVMTARINYLLATYDLIKESGSSGVEIPVYLCDSVSIPHETFDISLNGLVYEIQFPEKVIGNFRLPKDPHVLDLLQILEHNVSRPFDFFLNDVESKLGIDFALKYKSTIRNLHSKLADLEKKGVNEIWCRFLSNYFHPLIVEPFDYVIGNPPWVSPERVPKEYRDGINNLVKKSGYLEPYQPHFSAVRAHFAGSEKQYASCLAFFPRTFQNYLRKGGKMTFLLTSSLLTYLNSGGFREQIVKKRLQKIIDFTLYTSIHEGASCWAFAPIIENIDGSAEDLINYSFMIPIEENKDPEDSPIFKIENWSISKKQIILDEKSSRSPWFVAKPNIISIFRKMLEKPRIGDLYNLNMGIKSSANNIYILEEIKLAEENLLICKTLGKVKVNIEKSIVFPLVTGKNISAWNFNYEYIIIPHRAPDWKPIIESKFKKEYPNTYDYFNDKSRREKLLARKDYNAKLGLPFYMVFRISKQKVGNIKVAYGKLGKMLEASVIPAKVRDQTLGNSFIQMDSSTYFIQFKDEREAHYLSALLNSTALRAFSYGFGNPKGGVPFRQFLQWNIAILPIPKYNALKKECNELADLSIKAHEEPEKATDLQNKIDFKVAELFDLSIDEINQLREHYEMLSGKIDGI